MTLRMALVTAIAFVILLTTVPVSTFADENGNSDYVDRRVLMEMFTATWCGPCKFADPAAKRVAEENEGRAALVSYHFGGIMDPFTSPAAEIRAEDYGEPEKPTLWVDGLLDISGAENEEEVYATYRTCVEQRLKKPSPVQMAFAGELDGRSANVTVDIWPLSHVEREPVYMRFLVYENNLSEDGVRYDRVVRSMEEVNVSLDLSNITISLTIPLEDQWLPENLGFVAFLQIGRSGEVLQSIDRSANNLSRPIALFGFTNGTVLTGNLSLGGFATSSRQIEHVEISIDGGQWRKAEGRERWTFELRGVSLSEGSHEIAIRAFDGENYSSVQKATIIYRPVSEASVQFVLVLTAAVFLPAILLLAIDRLKGKGELRRT